MQARRAQQSAKAKRRNARSNSPATPSSPASPAMSNTFASMDMDQSASSSSAMKPQRVAGSGLTQEQMRAFLGVAGVGPSRQAKKAVTGHSDEAYYGRNALPTAGKFKTPGVQHSNLSANFGQALVEQIPEAAREAMYLPDVLEAGNILGERVRVSHVPGQQILVPFLTQQADVGVATYNHWPAKSNSQIPRRSWTPIGGAKFLQSLKEQRSQGNVEEYRLMLVAAAALGLKAALAKDGIIVSGFNQIQDSNFKGSYANVDKLYNSIQFDNKYASQKGQLGIARLVGTRPDTFGANHAEAMEAFGEGRKIKLPGFNIGSLRGSTAFPMRNASGAPAANGSGSCTVDGSGPGLTPNWRFSPHKSKAGTHSCKPTLHVNPNSLYKMNSRNPAQPNQKLETYLKTLSDAGESIAPQFEQAAFNEWAKANKEYRFYRQEDPKESQEARKARTKAAHKRDHEFTG